MRCCPTIFGGVLLLVWSLGCAFSTCYFDEHPIWPLHDYDRIVLTQTSPVHVWTTAYHLPGLTKTGTPGVAWETAAVRQKDALVPLGSWIYAHERWWQVTDTGKLPSAPSKYREVDFFLSSHEEAKEYGVRKVEVRVLWQDADAAD